MNAGPDSSWANNEIQGKSGPVGRGQTHSLQITEQNDSEGTNFLQEFQSKTEAPEQNIA